MPFSPLLKLRGRSALALFALLLTSQLSSCAIFPSQKTGELPIPEHAQEDEAKVFRRELEEQIILGVREAIREEILPELSLLSPVPKKIRKAQITAQEVANSKVVLGRIEWVTFANPSYRVQARVDSGAQTCSLHAENLQEKSIDGEAYVQFETYDHSGEKHVLLRKVVATRKVRSTSGKVDRRFVIREKITLGGRTVEININLNNRTDLRYPFLIGRNLLMGHYVVDVSQSRLLGR